MNLLSNMFDRKESRYWGYRGIQANIMMTGLDFAVGSTFPKEEEPDENIVFRKKAVSVEE